MVIPVKKLKSNISNQLLDELNEFIHGIINDESVGAQALIMLSAFCDNESQLYRCDTELLMEKLIELEPDNIASFMTMLDQNIELQDPSEIKQALTLMAKSKYHNHYFNILPEFEKAVTDYVDENPYPQSSIERSMDMYGFDDANLNYSQKQLEDNMLYAYLIGVKMAIAMPSYRELAQVCMKSFDLTKECMKISDTLINKSFTYIAKKIGYTILMKIYENSGDDRLYDIVKKSEVKFTNEYSCIINSLMPTHDSGFLITKKMFQSSNKVEIESGELAGFIKLAELLYQENLQNGYNDAINPASCYQ